MSRTYRNYIRQGICYGDNRDFYYFRKRHFRTLRKNNLRKWKSLDIQEFSDEYQDPKYPKKDTWSEPSDGYWLITKEYLKWSETKGTESWGSWMNRHKKTLKNKHYGQR